MSSITFADPAEKQAKRRAQGIKDRAAYLEKHGVSRSKRYYDRNTDKAKASAKRWHEANKEKAHARMQRNREQFPEACRGRHLVRKYGITLENYAVMSERQGHACLICRASASAERNGNLHVDHDHDTGWVRGLLCNRCNSALGSFRDDQQILRAAIWYLERGRKAMSDFTFADNKFGGRLTVACEAIGAGHLNRAAGILNELADELNVEATQAGLLSEDAEAPETPQVYGKPPLPLGPPAPQLNVALPAAGMEMCTKNVHSYGPADPVSGWRECAICGSVNVAPPSDGPYDMSARQ